MSSQAKSYAQKVLDGYNDTLTRLAQRYSSAIATIDTEHNAINSEIGKRAQKEKNMADASNKMALKNIQRGLLDKRMVNLRTQKSLNRVSVGCTGAVLYKITLVSPNVKMHTA